MIRDYNNVLSYDQLCDGSYLVGCINLDNVIDWGMAPIYELRNGEWFDEDGAKVLSVWDPTCQYNVPIESADGFVAA